MGATTSGGSVVETIRQQLSAGYTGDQVVEGLMAGGLSRPSAERFVQRAGGHVTNAAPPPIPSLPAKPALVVPPPVPTDYQPATETVPFHQVESFHEPAPFQQDTSFDQTGSFHEPAPAAPARTQSPMNGLKLAGGAALLLVGVALLAFSLSASGRVRLKLPLALVLGGGATLVQAIRER